MAQLPHETDHLLLFLTFHQPTIDSDEAERDLTLHLSMAVVTVSIRTIQTDSRKRRQDGGMTHTQPTGDLPRREVLDLLEPTEVAARPQQQVTRKRDGILDEGNRRVCILSNRGRKGAVPKGMAFFV